MATRLARVFSSPTATRTEAMNSPGKHAARPQLDSVANEIDESDDEDLSFDSSGLGLAEDHDVSADYSVGQAAGSDSGLAADQDVTTDSVADHAAADPGPGTEDAVVDIVVNNVCCSFDLGCRLNLGRIAAKGINVEYKTGQCVRLLCRFRLSSADSIARS